MSNTLIKIKEVLAKFNAEYNDQVNLASPGARDSLAELIYNAIMKQEEPGTYNDQQTFNFSNKETREPK